MENLIPAEELWQLPEDAPQELMDEMAGEEEVRIIFEGYFGKQPPSGWTIGLARAMVNLGRQRKYLEWKETGNLPSA